MRAAHWAETTPAVPAYMFVCYRTNVAGARETLRGCRWTRALGRSR